MVLNRSSLSTNLRLMITSALIVLATPSCSIRSVARSQMLSMLDIMRILESDMLALPDALSILVLL